VQEEEYCSHRVRFKEQTISGTKINIKMGKEYEKSTAPRSQKHHTLYHSNNASHYFRIMNRNRADGLISDK